MTPKSLLGALRFAHRGRSRGARDRSPILHCWTSCTAANVSPSGGTTYRDGELLPTIAEMDAFLSERVWRNM